jgi:hypothetical protein
MRHFSSERLLDFAADSHVAPKTGEAHHGSRGLGLALAPAFVRRGAKVATCAGNDAHDNHPTAQRQVPGVSDPDATGRQSASDPRTLTRPALHQFFRSQVFHIRSSSFHLRPFTTRAAGPIARGFTPGSEVVPAVKKRSLCIHNLWRIRFQFPHDRAGIFDERQSVRRAG